jgi:hypothetical protein
MALHNQKVHAQRPSDFNADSIMITIFLKHQQDKNLDSLQVIQRKINSENNSHQPLPG